MVGRARRALVVFGRSFVFVVKRLEAAFKQEAGPAMRNPRERRAASGERRAGNGERRAASGERRAASGERRAAKRRNGETAKPRENEWPGSRTRRSQGRGPRV